MIITTQFEILFYYILVLRCSQLIKRDDVFFHNTVYLYFLCNKAANRNSLFASQVVFEVVTSGHPGYVAIDEVKVLGHPCSKYLSAVLKPAL